jgi:dienelactone hydrolase
MLQCRMVIRYPLVFLFTLNSIGSAQTAHEIDRKDREENPIGLTDAEYFRQVPQHPLRAETDLRDMLRRHLITRSLAALDRADQRREQALETGRILTYQQDIIETVQQMHGEMPAGKNSAPIQVTRVSTFEKAGYRIENILFDSFPRWQVNATVYVPKNFPPPFYAVVVPVGHSGKQFENYQLPCQYFAQAGYLAITFDPPGQASEKKPGNDHFIDGVRCYLTGETSSKYFIADAIRCVDYLATRPDVDLSRGVAMTGVSGGGTTTVLAGILDPRFRVLGPSCCLAPAADHSVRQCYAGCPEGRIWRRFARGIDDVDLLCAANKPTLLMAGALDEVYRIEDTRTLARLVARFYQSAGKPDQFEFFVDAGGHAYSLIQARKFTQFMDRWLAQRGERPLPAPDAAQFTMNPYDELRCYPRTDVNMFTLTRDYSEVLRQKWDLRPEAIHAAVGQLAQVRGELPVPPAKTGTPFLVWTHYWKEVLLKPEPGIELPGTYFYAPPEKNHGTILHFDDQGRHRMMEKQNHLMQPLNFLDRPAQKISLLSVDLRGWGDSEMSVYPYEVASWGSRDRFTAYTSFALGDPILAMRIRDGMSALAWLRAQPESAGKPILLTGAGQGGIVALHVAAMDRNLAGVVIWDALISYHDLLETPDFSWPAEALLPGILKFYDLPELGASLPAPVFIFNPRGGDANRLPAQKLNHLNQSLTREMYRNAEWPEMIERIQRLIFLTETGGG